MARRQLLIFTLALAILLAAAMPADAGRRPTKSETGRIYLALSAANKTCSRYPLGTCKIGFSVSEVNPRWAVARLRADTNGENIVPPQTISLYRKHRRGHFWVVNQAGDGGGCGVPKRPRRDLNMICLPFSHAP
jgi:hypothetical protein